MQAATARRQAQHTREPPRRPPRCPAATRANLPSARPCPPAQALESVAGAFLAEEDLPPTLRDGIVCHMVGVHQSVRAASVRFEQQLRRHNYVTVGGAGGAPGWGRPLIGGGMHRSGRQGRARPGAWHASPPTTRDLASQLPGPQVRPVAPPACPCITTSPPCALLPAAAAAQELPGLHQHVPPAAGGPAQGQRRHDDAAVGWAAGRARGAGRNPPLLSRRRVASAGASTCPSHAMRCVPRVPDQCASLLNTTPRRRPVQAGAGGHRGGCAAERADAGARGGASGHRRVQPAVDGATLGPWRPPAAPLLAQVCLMHACSPKSRAEPMSYWDIACTRLGPSTPACLSPSPSPRHTGDLHQHSRRRGAAKGSPGERGGPEGAVRPDCGARRPQSATQRRSGRPRAPPCPAHLPNAQRAPSPAATAAFPCL